MIPRGRAFFRTCLAALLVAALALQLGCSGGPEQIDASGSYPTLGDAKPTRDHRTALVVLSATFLDLNLADDSGTMTRHTGYTIYTDKGEQVMYVRNFIGIHDREPTTIELEPGAYLILLDQPEKGQPPLFRVVLQLGKLTTVQFSK